MTVIKSDPTIDGVDPELLAVLKALSDASRLRIVGLLGERAYSVEELAAAVGISPPTVVHHLKRLRSAGLVNSTPDPPYVRYSLRLERLHDVGRRLGELERETSTRPVRGVGAEAGKAAGGVARDAGDDKILHAFVVDGRLASIPAQDRKRQVILRWLLERVFDEPREYPEREVNDRLRAYHEDVASLRRYLVEAGFVTRQRGVYRRAEMAQAAVAPEG